MSERCGWTSYETESGPILPHSAVSFAQRSNKFGLAIPPEPGIATIKVAVISTSQGVGAGVHAYIRRGDCTLHITPGSGHGVVAAREAAMVALKA
jgi:hypothetical protein